MFDWRNSGFELKWSTEIVGIELWYDDLNNVWLLIEH